MNEEVNGVLGLVREVESVSVTFPFVFNVVE